MKEKYSHKELVEIGYKWVMNRCSFAFKELSAVTGFGEIPDVLGFNGIGTFLLEAKTSRSDFMADKKKIFRINPEYGMGDWRFYICQKDVISINDLPELWGLIEVENNKARLKHNPFGKGNIYSRWEKNEKYRYGEYLMMYSALRRLQLTGNFDIIYPTK